MTWLKLTDLPEQRMPMHIDREKSFWEIQDGKIVHQTRVNRTADVESFEVLEGSDFIARDKTFVYHAWTTMKTVDRDTFTPLGDGYFRDKDCGYCEFETSIKPLKSGSAQGLKVIGAGYARDAAFAYYCGRPITSCTLPMTLKLVEQTGEHSIPAATTDTQCFYEGALIKGADVTTWKMGANGFSRDARNVFYNAKKLTGARPDDWKFIKPPYSTSDDKIYFMSFVLKDVDKESFEILADGTARDKHSRFTGKNRI